MDTTPDRPVVDFDHHSEAYTAHSHEWQKDMRAKCPVAWSEHHGGFWVLTKYEDIFNVSRDPAAFSSFHDVSPDFPGPRGYQGNAIPAMATQLLPPECDPPVHTQIRQGILTLFSPQKIERFIQDFQDAADFCIDRCIDKGEIDFAEDFAILQSTLATCRFMGLPTEGKVKWANTIKLQPQLQPDDPQYTEIVVKGWEEINQELTAVAADRRRNPTGDIISQVVQNLGEGNDYATIGTLTTIFAGGVETTSSVLLSALVYLDENRKARQMLIDDPSLMPKAREEFLRHFTPVPGLARTATKDTMIGDQKISAGERVLMWFYAANHDPAKFEKPDEVILDRKANVHVSFGLGPHRCIGSNIARKNFDIMLDTILRRMPDYMLDKARVKRYRSTGQSNSYTNVPARFTPGPKVGVQFSL